MSTELTQSPHLTVSRQNEASRFTEREVPQHGTRGPHTMCISSAGATPTPQAKELYCRRSEDKEGWEGERAGRLCGPLQPGPLSPEHEGLTQLAILRMGQHHGP